MHRSLLDYRPEIDESHVTELAAAGESAASERNELTLATELLERAQSGEADAFVVELIDRAARGAGRSPPAAARPLAQLLSQAARFLWQRDGLPSSHRAARAFGLAFEGLSQEDRAFEVARQFVRFAGDATRRMLVSPTGAPPAAVADRATQQSARALAPGLARHLALPLTPSRPRAAGSPATRHSARASRRPGLLDTTEESVMHDTDRTQLEFSSELPGFESGSFNNESFEFDAEEGLLSEADEAELADELLGVSNEEELDHFLRSVIGRVARGAGKVLSSSVGKAVGGVLKGVAKKALPLAGGWVGGPLGAKIGSGLASAAGSALGLEGESFDGEGEQYEGAKQFVRLAADTVAKAAAAPPSADPRSVAQRAAIGAARQLAPGLLSGQGGAGPGRAKGSGSPRTGGAQSGRWARQGSKVVLYGL